MKIPTNTKNINKDVAERPIYSGVTRGISGSPNTRKRYSRFLLCTKYYVDIKWITHHDWPSKRRKVQIHGEQKTLDKCPCEGQVCH